VVLDAGQLAALRDKLLAEVASLTSAEFAVTWASRALPAKNSLIAADAKLVEDAFEQKLSGLSSGVVNEISTGERAAAVEVTSQDQPQTSRVESGQPDGVDKASSRSPNHAVIAIGRTFGSLPNRPASSVAASRRTPTTGFPASCARPQGQR
jgi:hypothetical protein